MRTRQLRAWTYAVMLAVLAGCAGPAATPTSANGPSALARTTPLPRASKVPTSAVDKLGGNPASRCPARTDAEYQQSYLSGTTLGIIDDPIVVGYMSSVATELLNEVPGQRPVIKIFLTADANISRFSEKECSIFISLEFVRLARNADEIAAVLAHEISHILLGHFSDQALFNSLAVMGNLAYAALALGSGGGTVTMAQALGMVAPSMGGEAIAALGHPAWSRDQELEADQLGAELMIRAGYDTAGIADSLEVAEAMENQSVQGGAVTGSIEGLLAQWIQERKKSHPMVRDRLAKVAEYQRATYPFPSVRSDRNDAFVALENSTHFVLLVGANLGSRIVTGKINEAINKIRGDRNEEMVRHAIEILSTVDEPWKASFPFQYSMAFMDGYVATGEFNHASVDVLAALALRPDAPKAFQIDVGYYLFVRNRPVDAAGVFEAMYASRKMSTLDYKLGILAYEEARKINRDFDGRLHRLVFECKLRGLKDFLGNISSIALTNPGLAAQIENACNGRSGPIQ